MEGAPWTPGVSPVGTGLLLEATGSGALFGLSKGDFLQDVTLEAGDAAWGPPGQMYRIQSHTPTPAQSPFLGLDPGLVWVHRLQAG